MCIHMQLELFNGVFYLSRLIDKLIYDDNMCSNDVYLN